MNYVGHAFVATKTFPGANDFLIYGSMLPDFIGMARTKLNPLIEDSDILAGVNFHYNTDSTFNRNLYFNQIKKEFFARHSEFLPRGAAKACADPGSEILLDGYVVKLEGVAEMYERVMRTVNRSSFWVSQLAINSTSLFELNSKMNEYGAPFIYSDPEFAAASIYRRLIDRRRLRFEENFIPRVAEVFEDQQRAIFELAPKMLSQTIDELSTA